MVPYSILQKVAFAKCLTGSCQTLRQIVRGRAASLHFICHEAFPAQLKTLSQAHQVMNRAASHTTTASLQMTIQPRGSQSAQFASFSTGELLAKSSSAKSLAAVQRSLRDPSSARRNGSNPKCASALSLCLVVNRVVHVHRCSAGTCAGLSFAA